MASSSNVGTRVVALPVLRPLNSDVIAWCKRERHLSATTLEKLPVGCVTAWFPELKRNVDAVAFRYPGDGWKARAMDDVKAFTQSKGNKAQFWNLEAVLASKSKRVFITEGEFDAAALVEAGAARSDEVLSAPCATKGNHEYAHEALKAGLAAKDQFIWCGDQDEAGLALRADMAMIFGTARFYFVEWPEGCKDANKFLQTDGPNELKDRINGLQEWPSNGIYRLSELPEHRLTELWDVGMEGWGQEVDEIGNVIVDAKVRVAPGTTSVVSGHPGHGKTVLWQQLWFQVIREQEKKGNHLVACMASFETRPRPHLQRQLRTLYSGKLVKDMSDAEKNEADAWINEHYLFLVHPDRRPDLRWLLDQAEIASWRYGAKILSLDPWNRLESSRPPTMSETDYIGDCLHRGYNFASEWGYHLQIIAHPAKPDNFSKGKPPEPSDIAGSKHWDNAPDQIFIVWRKQMFNPKTGERITKATMFHKKTRYDELGYPTILGIDYDLKLGRFVVDKEIPDDGEQEEQKEQNNGFPAGAVSKTVPKKADDQGKLNI